MIEFIKTHKISAILAAVAAITVIVLTITGIAKLTNTNSSYNTGDGPGFFKRQCSADII